MGANYYMMCNLVGFRFRIISIRLPYMIMYRKGYERPYLCWCLQQGKINPLPPSMPGGVRHCHGGTDKGNAVQCSALQYIIK